MHHLALLFLVFGRTFGFLGKSVRYDDYLRTNSLPSNLTGDDRPGSRSMVVVLKFMEAAMMVISKTKDGDAETDDGHGRQEDEDKHERPIHIGKVELDDFTRSVSVQANSMSITCAKRQGGQAQADHGAGGNNRSANCSHG
jgi:hypothetical protein